jgi:transcription elongation factor GreA
MRAFPEPGLDTATDGGPAENGVAEPGMVVTVYYHDTGAIDTFLLGAGDDDIAVHSIRSPLGQAIAGARPGEQRTYTMPKENTRNVTLLHAVPFGTHIAKRVGSQDGPLRNTCSGHRTGVSTLQQSNPFWTTELCTAI